MSRRRLADAEIITIRTRWAAEQDRRRRADAADLWPYPVTLQSLADEFSVSRVTIWNVVHRTAYRHLPPASEGGTPPSAPPPASRSRPANRRRSDARPAT